MGPLPSPEDVQQFNHIVEDGAERIFRMAEHEQAHRISTEQRELAHRERMELATLEADTRAQAAEITFAKWGFFAGLLLSLAAVAAAAFAVWKGADWRAIAVLAAFPVAAGFLKALFRK
jgi:uncharacterized membrane protein